MQKAELIPTERHLLRHASEHPAKTALIVGGESVSYASLAAMVRRRASEIISDNPGRTRVFRASASVDFFVEYFATHLAGKVAVPLEKDVPDELFRTVSALVADNELPGNAYDILFTTGTTGRSKGVIVGETANAANADNLIHGLGFHDRLTFVVSGPLNHIGSLSKIHPTITAGGTVSVVDGMRDLASFFGALENVPHTSATFLVPASIRMILQLAPEQIGALASKIEFIETGAAPMPLSDMQALSRLLPHSRLFNTYASTETGVISTFNFNEGEAIAGCVGRPMRHSQVELTPDGFIVCRGLTLMDGYVGDPEATQSILYDGAIHTRDFARLNSDGLLMMLGRNDDVINTGGYKVSPVEVEDAAMGVDGIADCLCVPVEHPVSGHVLKLLVVPSDPASPPAAREIAQALRTRLESYKIPLRYEYVDSIARTFNGKPDRKRYC